MADTLLLSPLSAGQPGQLHEDVVAHVNAITSSWPVSNTFLDRIRTETEKDVDLNTAVQNTVSGRPHRHQNISDLEIFSRRLVRQKHDLQIVSFRFLSSVVYMLYSCPIH